MTHTLYASCPQPKGDGHPMNGTPNDHRRRVGLPPNGNDVENRGNDYQVTGSLLRSVCLATRKGNSHPFYKPVGT